MYKVDMTYEEFLKKEQEKYPELKLNDIESLKERVKANTELPYVRDKLIILFLHGSYFDVDIAYKTIVIHYKYRKDLPQVFANYDPTTAGIKKVFNSMSICLLPNIYTDKHERFIYTNFKNPDPREYDFIQSVRYFFMMLEYMLETNGSFDGLVVTLNSLGMNWRHITMTPMNTMKKLLGFVQDALPVRLKEVHVLNAGSMMSVLFNIIKPFMRSGLMSILKLHPEGSKDIFNHVPIELLPTEIGGTGKSHYEYSEDTLNEMVSVRDWLFSLDSELCQ
ncbi:alpha-tocopherol transfer protein-like [Sipha flava]|uniref:Alpha-tocopherol transfer protein-like n=1 Tax=Sipha flava TaxID=143950 RepID=A0A2S2QET7_9HEMI|nr:alpha-tocopherol transfer protein-like [Sipha flava]XP_025410039.1 alpha-tocopherol transfer protein-like [Sipha flava]